MRVLVTGVSGLIGGRLVARLVADKHQVTGLDARATPRQGATFHRFDLTSPDLTELLRRAAPDVVCHLASSDLPGSLNLLEACSRTGVARVVLASSGSVYGGTQSPATERLRPVPRTLSAAGLVAVEAFAETHERRHGPAAAVLRLGDVYGDLRTGVVGAFATAMRGGRPGRIHGDGATARDYVHVDDVVDALVRCLGGKGDGRRLNIGTGVATSTRRLHSLMAAAIGVPDAPGFDPAPVEVPQVVLDSGAARRALGWEAQVTLEQGVARTVEDVARQAVAARR